MFVLLNALFIIFVLQADLSCMFKLQPTSRVFSNPHVGMLASLKMGVLTLRTSKCQVFPLMCVIVTTKAGAKILTVTWAGIGSMAGLRLESLVIQER